MPTGKARYPHLYSGKRWERLRQHVQARDLWTCQQTGALLRPGRQHPLSAVVHHIKPHKGDPDLFYDPDNCQLVSKEWHDGEARRQERSKEPERDEGGWLVYRPTQLGRA